MLFRSYPCSVQGPQRNLYHPTRALYRDPSTTSLTLPVLCTGTPAQLLSPYCSVQGPQHNFSIRAVYRDHNTTSLTLPMLCTGTPTQLLLPYPCSVQGPQHNFSHPTRALYRDPNTIFRGNTLASKCMDELMKLTGHHYLKETLKPAIDQVGRGESQLEIR